MTGKNKGLSLIDVLVGISLMLVVFVSLVSAFRAAIKVIEISKIRAGAVALANEKMESIRNLPYGEIGTQGGIPSGNIPQEENLYLNRISYVSRTLIQYIDDPADGEGENDENGITTDYKKVKVEISWLGTVTADPIVLVTDLAPKSMETTAGGGTLKINVFNASISPVNAALVTIENETTDPAISVAILTNLEGKVSFPGTPASSNYKITVSKDGYNSAQTHDATAENPAPQPGHLTIIEGGTTESSFSIDLLSAKTVRTYIPANSYVWTDTFPDENKISATSSTVVTDERVELELSTSTGYALSGYIISKTIVPSELDSWTEFSWNDEKDASTTIKYQILYFDSAGWIPVPDSDLSGNSIGFENAPINLTGMSSSTYPEIRLQAELSTIDASTTPRLLDWQTSWEASKIPLASLPFNMRGSKTIGSDPLGDPIYKYSENLSTDTEGNIHIPELEWDNYLITVNGSTSGYDVSESCPFQPANIVPGTDNSTELILTPHQNNTLLVYTENTSGDFVPDVSVRLYKTGYDKTLQTSHSCGQAFFSPLSSSNSYTVEATKTGYQDFILTDIEVTGQTNIKITLSSL